MVEDDAVASRPDVVVLAVGGVQSFISESRSTSDLASASAIMSRLSGAAAHALKDAGAELVFPVQTEETAGVPNRVVALAPAGKGAGVAEAAARVVQQRWDGWVQALFQASAQAPSTPGMPSVQWVSVPAGGGGYAEQWRAAQRVLVARRRIRSFPTVEQLDQRLCSLSPRWPAVPDTERPSGRDRHDTDVLSAASWVKRLWRKGLDGGEDHPPGFPSTSSIASASFRREVLLRLDHDEVRAAVEALHDAVQTLGLAGETAVSGLPGGHDWFRSSSGPWVYREGWETDVLRREVVADMDVGAAAAQGAAAVDALHRAMGILGVGPPTSYLALVVADLDGLGRHLSGERLRVGDPAITPEWHQEMSSALVALGKRQRSELASEQLLGVPVYAGGDDLLAFAPAARALELAQRCHDLVPEQPPDFPTTSTAVLFFHRHSSLVRAVTEAQALLAAAKRQVPGKHALALGYLRRSGTRLESLQPWVSGAGQETESTVELFRVFARPEAVAAAGNGRVGPQLSPRLVYDLARDEDELATLSEQMLESEVLRLVNRHGGDARDAHSIIRLGRQERTGRTPQGDATFSVAPARIAVFLRQECR